MSLNLNELKALHDRGLALIYLHPRQKRPIENGWTTGPRKTWAELKRDFNPSYNVGVRLGEPSKIEGQGYLCCIDVDIKDPAYKTETLQRLKEITKNDIYPTVLSGSGSGSCHLYAVSVHPFKMVEIEKHKDQWEICAYSTGRQMVLPPSIHPDTGMSYVWHRPITDERLQIFDHTKFSRKLSGIHQASSETRTVFKAAEVDLYSSKLDIPTIKQITDGEGVTDRSASLMSIAMKMCRKRFTDDEILSVLSDENNWIAGAAFDHTQSRDRGRAVRWLRRYTLEKARYETDPLRLFEGKPDLTLITKTPQEKKTDMAAIRTEQNEVLPDIVKGGKPKNSLRNVVHVLEHFMGGKLVGYNEFTCRPYFLKDTVYDGKKGRELADADDLALKHYLAEHYGFEPSKELCFEAHTFLAQRYKFHPVKAYLETLEWDGRPRLDSWLSEAFRASGPREYVEAVARKVLVAAVARIYEPGCKFDYMTVLEGNQGEGKSMSLEILVGRGWFADSLGDIRNKDVVDQMMGKWLIEVSELDSIRGRDAEAVKAFISRQVDRVRLSYARRAQDYPRQIVFIGSTNDEEYLTDETGNRRYWPIKVGIARRKWLRENRDQLWAEAVFRYELGERLWLPKHLEAIARAEQEKRFEVDEWEIKIKKIIKCEVLKAPFTATKIWQKIHNSNEDAQPPMNESRRIGRIMRRLGFKKTAVRTDGVLGKCWIVK